jgi:hypothetical protein
LKDDVGLVVENPAAKSRCAKFPMGAEKSGSWREKGRVLCL